MDKTPVYRTRAPLWAITFESDDYQRAPSLGGLRTAFNERNNIPMDNLRTRKDSDDGDNLDNNCFENIELDTMENEGGDADISHMNRVHSIHRNRLKDSKKCNVEPAIDARVGGLNMKTMNQNQPGNMQECIENHADLIVTKMEQDSLLMEDSPTSEELRKDMLRDMPQCLTLKRCVKQKLSISVSQKSKRKPLGCFKIFKYRMSMGVSNFKLNLKNLAYSFELWYGTVRQIEGNFGSGVASYFKFLRWMFLMNVFVAIISLSFIVIPQISLESSNSSPTKDFHVSDIFTGEGYLTNTFIYYGFYSNQSISQSSLTYDMPAAYFFTMVFLYLCCFAVLGVSTAISYRRSFIETEGGLTNIFANKIFCGWDYNIATDDAAKLKSRAIFNELTELLYDVMYQSEKDPCIVMFWTITMQVTMNILVVLSFAASGYLMWFLMDLPTENQWRSIYSAVAINLIMTLLPIVFSWVIKYEGYKSPRRRLLLTLARTFVLGFVIIGVPVTFWLKNRKDACWETSLGQEIYRLILFDFVFSVIVSPLVDLISYCSCRLMCGTRIHFDIARHTMQIIYNQTLFWVGLFFSPFLAVIVVVKLLLTWYIRKTLVMRVCQPPSKSWRAAQTTTWFLMLSLLSLLLVMALLGYIITSTPTTDSCGPFRHYHFIYEIITMGILNLRKGDDVWRILLFVTKPGFIALVLIAFGGRVYYIRARAQARLGMVAIYREMLLWEARDKKFLLKKLSQITKGVWQYKLQEGRKPDPMISHQGILRPRVPQLRRDSIRSSFASAAAGPSLADDIDVLRFPRYKKNS